ncbi:translation initiation factor [Ereboglobus luteus]|uniref:Translation initiation factor n=1 Tax=Ereboglobus luteus TaxID=1796921 RepID=A0A2U8DZN7_9BACT|nr:translation initiation factor [Ereboglobus luteus]AWI08056.1 translation initiation factor [Ereboglobus luteus]
MSADKHTRKIPTDGGRDLTQNVFASLSGLENLKPTPASTPAPQASPSATPAKATAPAKNRGRVDVIREKAGRGGKTVTVARGFTGIGLPEKEALAKKMRAACGTGGTVKDGCIEIQGDKRDEVARILAKAGFRPVFAGG